MDQTELCYLPATDLAAKMRARDLSPVEVVDAFLDRIDRINPLVNAFCTLTADQARAEAKVAEAAIMNGADLGLLHGIPFAVKDLVMTRGVRTTRGSLLHADDIPTADAPVVDRLKRAGGVMLGKTNTPELGWKGTTHNRVFGPTRNPWNLDCTPGGSSGGSGAAVAAGLGPLAVGTDGGGSIRIPAAFCGIFGLKPTFGLVPAYPPSSVELLAHSGPMTRTVRDAALMLTVMAGPDERDRNSYLPPVFDYLSEIDNGIAGLRVAWSESLGFALVDPEIAAICDHAALHFLDLGCFVESTPLNLGIATHPWEVIFYSSIAATLEGMPDGWQDKVDPGLLAVVARARRWSGLDVIRAVQARGPIYDTVRQIFDTYDLLITPSMAIPPFAVGIDAPDEIAGHKVSGLDWSPFTYPFNVTGHPAATVPCGWTKAGLPVGLQIVGPRMRDDLVLRAAAAFEAVAPWADRIPKI